MFIRLPYEILKKKIYEASQVLVADQKSLFVENMSLLADIFVILIIFISALYGYVRFVYTYWQRRGVKHLPPTFPFGNFSDSFLQKISIGELVEKMYYQTNEPFIGIYGAIRPTLLIRDLHLIRRVLIKDFQHFVDRGMLKKKKKIDGVRRKTRLLYISLHLLLVEVKNTPKVICFDEWLTE